MNKVKNILVLQSRIEILVTVPGLGHGVPVYGFHTRPYNTLVLAVESGFYSDAV